MARGMHGGGHEWLGVCMAGGMHGGGMCEMHAPWADIMAMAYSQ